MNAKVTKIKHTPESNGEIYVKYRKTNHTIAKAKSSVNF